MQQDSHKPAGPIVRPEQLCVGLYIHLDLPWISHPFPFPSFKIVSDEQIATLKSLGLKEVRYSPGKSDCAPLSAAPQSDAAAGQEEAPVDAPHPIADDPAAHAKQSRIRRLAAQREKIAACEREFANTTRQMKAVRQNLFSRPEQVCEQAIEAIDRLADSMLVDAELSIHLMSDKVTGDDVFNHSLNVSLLSMMIGREMKLPATEIKLLGLGALMHDLGEAEIPGHIKNKTTPLTRPEAALMQQHCAKGVALGKTLGLPPEALLIIAEHHEHCDGTGYPRRLHEAQLAPLARIVAVIEAYEELCSPRALARTITPHEALSMIYAQQGKLFDAAVVTSFVRCLSVYPPGTLVLLSNGVLGVVVAVNSDHLLKPTVMIYDSAIAHGETAVVDLQFENDVSIVKTLKPQQLPPEIGQFFAARKRPAYYFSTEPRGS